MVCSLKTLLSPYLACIYCILHIYIYTYLCVWSYFVDFWHDSPKQSPPRSQQNQPARRIRESGCRGGPRDSYYFTKHPIEKAKSDYELYVSCITYITHFASCHFFHHASVPTHLPARRTRITSDTTNGTNGQKRHFPGLEAPPDKGEHLQLIVYQGQHQ